MNAADKLVQNSLLTVVSRIAMILAIPVFFAICSFIWGISLAQTELDKRVTVIEARYAEINRQLNTLDERSVAILQTVARLEAKVSLSTNSSLP